MNIISWQEIVVRLLFALILGSATAISKRWYQTQKFIQPNTQIALGAAIFAMLATFTSETVSSSDLILGISIICLGVGLSKESNFKDLNTTALINLWSAGALGSMAGFGLFLPAYIGILMIVVTNFILQIPEKNLVTKIKKDFNTESKLESQTNLDRKSNSIIPLEMCFHCQVNCLVADEADVLALLVQLGKEKKLTPTRVNIQNMADNGNLSQVVIQVDFISNDSDSLLQIQQILTSLKSKTNVISASFIHMSPETNGKNNNTKYLLKQASGESLKL